MFDYIVDINQRAQQGNVLLGPLAWGHFPERDLSRGWQPRPTPYALFVAACLVKLDQQVVSMAQWRQAHDPAAPHPAECLPAILAGRNRPFE